MSLPAWLNSNPMRNLEKTIQLIRDLLFKLLNKEFLIFLFFLFLSGIFWLTLTLNETYERELRIPMRLVGTPSNVVITSPMADTLRVTLRDKGFVLLAYGTVHPIKPLTIAFNSFANKQTGHGVVPTAELQKYVKAQLNPSTVITAIKADPADFFFNYGLKKRLRITLDGNIVPKKNYYLSHVEFMPEMVTVYATKSKLDSLRAIPTEYLNIVGFDDTVTVTARLKPIRGVRYVPSTVKLRLYPDILTEESIEVPITAINKPDDLTIRTFPQYVKVNFTVGASNFRKIRIDDFLVVVDYNEVAAHPSDKCNLYLLRKPSFISHVSLAMQQVDYLIEQK